MIRFQVWVRLIFALMHLLPHSVMLDLHLFPANPLINGCWTLSLISGIRFESQGLLNATVGVYFSFIFTLMHFVLHLISPQPHYYEAIWLMVAGHKSSFFFSF